MKTIFQHELKHRLKQPFTWFFLLLFFVVPCLTIIGMGSEVSTRFAGRFLNSPPKIFQQSNIFVMMFYFVLPGIIGLSLYRDFGSRMHHLLYAFPLRKSDYFGGKFFSAFLVVVLIWAGLHFGIFIGGNSPFINPDLFGDYGFSAHVNPMLFQLPNLFVFSAIVFAVVSRSRNIYAGFIAVFLFLMFGKTVNVIFKSIENQWLAGLLDPTGTEAVRYYTRYWTIEESNTSGFPLHGLVFLNRMFWLAIGSLILAWAYRKFEFVHAIERKAFGKAKTAETVLKDNFRNITKVTLPQVKFDFSPRRQVHNIWALSKADFSFVIRSKAFIILLIAALAAIIFMVSNGMMRFGTQDYPLTRKMLDIPLFFFSMVVDIITFLYAGLLINRSRMANMHQLTDATAVPNVTLLLSKFLALVKMQAFLLLLIMLGGIIFQLTQGYFNLEIGQYLFELYIINLPHFAAWAMLAVFVHSIIPNPYLGFFLLIMGGIGTIALMDIGPKLGLDWLTQGMFRYNAGVGDGMGLPYSDMAGYGPVLRPYLLYKIYWTLCGSLLMVLAFLTWRRGMPRGIAERFSLLKSRMTPRIGALALVLTGAFLSLGATIYYKTNIENPFYTNNMRKPILLEAEKKYLHYKKLQMPKITDVKMEVDIYPEAYRFEAKGEYFLENTSDEVLDTLTVNHLYGLGHDYTFNRPFKWHSRDTLADFAHFDIVVLEEGLQPGEKLNMSFSLQSPEQTWFAYNDYVKANGTYITDEVVPRLGYYLDYARRKLNLSEMRRDPLPTDTLSLQKMHDSSDDMTRINFEALVSTSEEQVAIAPGQLQEEYVQDGRRYFKYKVAAPISHSYMFTSGEYAVAKEKWRDIDLEIYYHPDHLYNVDRMMEGLSHGLEYCSDNFSPYQFKQVRIVEFAQVGGASAHGFPSVIPFGEEAGFVANICDHSHCGNDFAYGGAIHEVAHMWWGHQIKPTARGARMVVESLPEYVNVMLKKKTRGVEKARDYMNNDIRRYLQGRNRERREETPLAYAHSDQPYIYYSKGLKVFYAMADYIGESKLNKAIGDYVKQAAYSEEYTTSVDMLNYIREATPDSLQYLIKDWYETVTLYDNQMIGFEVSTTETGQYKVDLDFQVSKHRIIGQGEKVFEEEGESLTAEIGNRKVQSLPLADYIEIGLFDENGKELYLQKHKITEIRNRLSLILDEKPAEGGVDPHILLIDAMMEDNRMK